MTREYRRELQNTWLILSGEDLPSEDSYLLRMLSENPISGLLSCRLARMDQHTQLYYDISGRHTLKDVMETEGIGRDLLEHMLISLTEVCETLEEYFLPPEGLLLLPEQIYTDPSKNRIGFCYYPGSGRSFSEQIRILSGSLLPHLDQEDKSAVVMGYGFYQCCTEETISLSALRGLIRRERPESGDDHPVTREELERSVILDSFFEEEDDKSVFHSVGSFFRNRFRKKDNGGEAEADPFLPVIPPPFKPQAAEKNEMVLPARETERRERGTTILDEVSLLERRTGRCLLNMTDRTGRPEVIRLIKDRYLIGKAEAGADVTPDSAAVSRMHARLRRQGDTYLLKDMNSRNGTRVNNILLLPEQEVLLADGDTICFADVVCRFRKEQ